MDEKPAKGALRVWWIPQFTCKSFRTSIESVDEGQRTCDMFAAYDQFQYDNNVRPDLGNSGGIEEFDGERWRGMYIWLGKHDMYRIDRTVSPQPKWHR